MTFSYAEANVDPENLTQTFKYNMKSTIRIFTSINQTKYVSLFFRKLEVETEKEISYSDEDVILEESIALDNVFIDTQDRGFGNTKSQKKPGATDAEDLDTPIMVFSVYSSNNQLEYTRVPPKFLDVLSNIGGIAGSIGFLITVMYSWYNGISMEQSLLNYGVLGFEDDVIYEPWESSRFFSFCEILYFSTIGALCCCCKKSKKHELYLRC